jgi:hypothetical protein
MRHMELFRGGGTRRRRKRRKKRRKIKEGGVKKEEKKKGCQKILICSETLSKVWSLPFLRLWGYDSSSL